MPVRVCFPSAPHHSSSTYCLVCGFLLPKNGDPREIVRSPLLLSSPHLCELADNFRRYSIALLVSLNNRISIRDATGNLVVSRKLPIELAVTTSTMTRTDSGTEISGMGSGRSSAMYKISGRWEV
jgi:hypothetical protein